MKLLQIFNECVLGATAVDALAIGYRTILLDDCSRGVDLLEIEKTKNTVIKNNGVIVNSNQVKGIKTAFSLTELYVF